MVKDSVWGMAVLEDPAKAISVYKVHHMDNERFMQA